MNAPNKMEQNQVVSDYEFEQRQHPIGKVCHLSTVTHAFRGTLLEVTPSYYVLDPEAKVALVDSTGSFSSYLAEMSAAREGDEFTPKKGKAGPTVRILRGAVSWMVSAP